MLSKRIFNTRVWFVLVVIVLALIFVQSKQVKLDSSLLSLFPQQLQTSELQQAIDQYSSHATNQILVLIGHPSITQAKQYSDKFLDGISQSEMVQFNVNNSDDFSILSLVNLYQSHAGYLLSDQSQAQLKNNQYQDFQQQLIGQLIQPGNPFVSETIEQDPSIVLSDYLQQLSAKAGSLTWSDGYLYQSYQDKHYIVLTGSLLNQGGLSIAESEHVVALIDEQLGLFKNQPLVEVYTSGVVFHTSASSNQAKAEINLFGSVSAIIIMLLVLITFSSFKPLLMVLMTLATAISFGIAGVFNVFSSIHLITFVLAISLIGICVDYSFHALCESEDNDRPVSFVARSLFIGFLTTAVGYSAILISPLTQFKALAVFIIFGLLGALLTVYMVFPLFLKNKPCKQSAFAKYIATHLARIIHLNWYHKFVYIVLAVCVALVLTMASKPVFNDDVRLLNSSPQSLINNEQRIRGILSPSWSPQAIFVKADSEQQVLELEEQLLPLLEQAISNGLLIDYLAVSSWLPSIEQQDRNYQLLQRAIANKAFEQLNEITGQSTELTKSEYLTTERIFDSQLGSQFKSQFIRIENENAKVSFFTVIRLKGVSDSKSLKQVFSKQENIYFFDKADEVTSILEFLRVQFSYVFLIAFVATAVLFSVIYGVKLGMKSSLLPAVASVLSLTLSFYWQGYLSIFNLIASLLVMALAIDYTVFYLEKGRTNKVVLAITLSMLSTCAGFGMLAFSSTPAVFSIGLTVLFGVICAYVISPLADFISLKNKYSDQ